MADDSIRLKNINHITYNVKNKDAALKWYTEVLGMDLMNYNEKGQMAFLSFGTQHHDIAVVKAPDDAILGSPGISHTALQIEGGLDELKELYQRMKDKGVEIDFTTDHGLSQSIYFFDPDRNRLEVFCETMSPEEGIEFMRAGRAGRDPLELEATTAS